MAKKRYINTVFWDDAYVANLDPSEKLLFIYLITNPCTNIAGIYQIPLKRIALDTGIDRDMCQKIIDRFQKDGKVLFSDGWMAVKNFIKHQSINPSVQTGIGRELDAAPNFLKEFVFMVETTCCDRLSKSDIDISLSLSLSPSLSQDKDKPITKNTIPPPIESIKQWNSENKIGLTDWRIQYAYDFYEKKGWIVGRAKMKDWQAAFRGVKTWDIKNEPARPKYQTI